MNDLQLFDFESQKIRTLLINNEPYFVGNDVATILGYSNYRNAVGNHVDDEDKLRTQIEYAGQRRNMTVINESGLYSLIFASKMPNARRFKHWVTSEVLPAIRKHGAYMTPEVVKKTLTDPDFIISIATKLKEEQQARVVEHELRVKAEERAEYFRPLAGYYRMIMDNPRLVNASEIADNYDMTTVEFNQLLHELGIQYKRPGEKRWRLYAKYKGKGWTSVSVKLVYGHEVAHMKWTHKGQLALYNLLKERGIVPTVERGYDYDF